MGFTELLTIIFIVLKVMDKIDWSWWLVLLPEIVAVVLYLSLAVIAAVMHTKAARKIDDHYKKYWGM